MPNLAVEPEKRRPGRPYAITPEIAERIAQRVASGRTLLDVSRDTDLPKHDAVWNHLKRSAEFAAQIARAQKISAHFLAQQIIEIADEKPADSVAAQWARNRCDQRKWLAGKYNQAYADKTSHEVTGANGGPIEVAVDDRRKSVAALIDGAFSVVEDQTPPLMTHNGDEAEAQEQEESKE